MEAPNSERDLERAFGVPNRRHSVRVGEEEEVGRSGTGATTVAWPGFSL